MPSLGSCKVCLHADVDSINAQLLNLGKYKRSLRGVASLYRLSHETLRRHFRACLGQAVPQPIGNQPQVLKSAYSNNIDIGQEFLTRAVTIDDRAQRCGSPNQMMSVTRELTRLIADLVQHANNK